MSELQPRDRLIVALDTADLDGAVGIAGSLGPEVGMVKVGLELFCAAGPEAVRAVGAVAPVFLDLKFHDIPNTVEGAARAAATLGARMLTVHGAGGAEMIGAAARGARSGAETAGVRPPLVIAVTVLSSSRARPGASVEMAVASIEAGADGVVVSGDDVGRVRAACGDRAMLVVPGIRPAGSDAGDQVRVLTPRAAVDAGADRIVVGRPITGASDPVAAARDIVASLR